ncbi:TetR/AcrR family transcriptional regulator [Streptomyces omiyaensis]|uniref:TetR/AcrR family transcriptional regulator n=1 Tax=Streptomyces omiyaensis TaxID=68247 RepID=A0ABW7BUJ7_9ACTN|nr:TetR/AcrR family transcriptional regulator [Streptomyces omiyaensis]GGY51730.1 TetR family transcriptional regulator [Streptomyces omiyaensis]
MNPTPNPQRRSEKSHRAILDAAMELCVEHGYGNVTVEAIAARAGVSKKTIYRWWPTKGAVVLEAFVELAGTATRFPDTGDVVADLRTQMTAVLANILSGPRASVYAGIIAETQHDPALARELRAQLLDPRVAAARDRLRLARDHGQLAPDADVEMVVDLLYGPLYYRLLLHLGPYPPARLRAHVAHVLGSFAPAPPASAAP